MQRDCNLILLNYTQCPFPWMITIDERYQADSLCRAFCSAKDTERGKETGIQKSTQPVVVHLTNMPLATTRHQVELNCWIDQSLGTFAMI